MGVASETLSVGAKILGPLAIFSTGIKEHLDSQSSLRPLFQILGHDYECELKLPIVSRRCSYAGSQVAVDSQRWRFGEPTLKSDHGRCGTATCQGRLQLLIKSQYRPDLPVGRLKLLR